MMSDEESTKLSFGGKIDADLKERIDMLLATARIPVGVAVETAAAWLAEMTPEELKMLCYGTDGLTLAAFVDARIRAFLQTPEARRLLARSPPPKRH